MTLLALLSLLNCLKLHPFNALYMYIDFGFVWTIYFLWFGHARMASNNQLKFCKFKVPTVPHSTA